MFNHSGHYQAMINVEGGACGDPYMSKVPPPPPPPGPSSPLLHGLAWLQPMSFPVPSVAICAHHLLIGAGTARTLAMFRVHRKLMTGETHELLRKLQAAMGGWRLRSRPCQRHSRSQGGLARGGGEGGRGCGRLLVCIQPHSATRNSQQVLSMLGRGGGEGGGAWVGAWEAVRSFPGTEWRGVRRGGGAGGGPGQQRREGGGQAGGAPHHRLHWDRPHRPHRRQVPRALHRHSGAPQPPPPPPPTPPRPCRTSAPYRWASPRMHRKPNLRRALPPMPCAGMQLLCHERSAAIASMQRQNTAIQPYRDQASSRREAGAHAAELAR